WFETIELRPWKSYQTQYFELKGHQLQSEYEMALREFQSPEIQQKYKQLKTKLKEAEKYFQRLEIQKDFIKTESELNKIRYALKKNQSEFQEARGKYLELEYVFYKHQREEDKTNLTLLEKEAEKIEKHRKELLRQEETFKMKLSGFTVEADKYIAEIGLFETKLNDAKGKLEKANEIPIEIKQIYIEDINKADRCQSCHLGIDKPEMVSIEQPFAPHPGSFIYLKNHPPGDFGCTFCHRGQGRATSSPEKAHGWVEHWLEPMLKKDMVQASCQTCHGDVQHIRGSDLIKEGSELVEKYGCYGCHKIGGYENLRKVGPELTEVGTKVNYSWLISWLLDPKSYVEIARMPNFNLSNEEADAIADYLFSMTREKRFDYSADEIDWELADIGKALWGQSRCSICHAINGVGGSFEKMYAPDLGKVGSKINREWLFLWMKDPKTYFPQTKMPRFRFTDAQIRALVEYLVGEYVDWDFEPQYTEPVLIEIESIQNGKELVQKYGCFGCHNVKGMEELKQIGPFLLQSEVTYLRVGEIDEKVGTELSSIGSKPLERLDFGKMEKEIPYDRINYIRQKLKDPRSFRDNLRMPNYRFSEKEVDALTALLSGFTDMDVPTRFKVPKIPSGYIPTGEFAKINDDVKCLNCHQIKGNGEEFAPDLSIEGSKVQERWLRKFLKRPDIIRPL
ncbi:MAG: c-type cytochrome, partial [Calditrichia bacterium]